VRWLVVPALVCAVLSGAPSAVLSDTVFADAPAPPGDAIPGDTTTTTLDPAGLASSAPLVPIPEGCPKPPMASVVFVGRVVAKDYRVARFQIEQVRAGSANGYQLGNLVDVRYDNDVEFLNTDDVYLVGAVPQGVDLALSSKVREAKPLLGGNAVVGLTEKSSECPKIEDPVRTFNVDGSEIGASIFKGLAKKKKDIALAFAKPILAVFAIVLVLVLIRWLLTAIVVAVRHLAENDTATVPPRE
jgi:hypothetical protein